MVTKRINNQGAGGQSLPSFKVQSNLKVIIEAISIFRGCRENLPVTFMFCLRNGKEQRHSGLQSYERVLAITLNTRGFEEFVKIKNINSVFITWHTLYGLHAV